MGKWEIKIKYKECVGRCQKYSSLNLNMLFILQKILFKYKETLGDAFSNIPQPKVLEI